MATLEQWRIMDNNHNNSKINTDDIIVMILEKLNNNITMKI